MRVAVIGAGPSGLAAARNLDRQGFDVVGFEVHDDVGGLWDIDSPTSTMYETAHLISSKTTTAFAEFLMADDVAAYPHHGEVRDYFRAYAAHFDLYGMFTFGCKVTAAVPDTNGWEVTSQAVGDDDDVHTTHVDALVLATGTFHAPNMPSWPGAFDGRLQHASEYRSPAELRGQRVLVVGCGNSGADIAVDAVHHAATVDLSVRRGYWFVPKFLGGRPIDTIGRGGPSLPRAVRQRTDAALIRAVVGRPSDYGLPDPDHRLYESHPVVNTQVLHHLGHGDIRPRPDVAALDGDEVAFVDGARGSYDLVLAATGYRLDWPFIDDDLLNWDGAAPALYLNTFHPGRNDLFVVGMVEATGLGWEGRFQQARLVAAYLCGIIDGTPAARTMHRRIMADAGERLTGGHHYLEVERMAYYVARDEFLDAVADHVAGLEDGAGTGP